MEVPSTTPTGGIFEVVGKRTEKDFKFCGSTIKIAKLTVSEVKQIQNLAREVEEREKALADNPNDSAAADAADESGLDILKAVIRLSVTDGKHLTDAHFEAMPMDELSKLANEIMVYSGIGNNQGKSA